VGPRNGGDGGAAAGRQAAPARDGGVVAAAAVAAARGDRGGARGAGPGSGAGPAAAAPPRVRRDDVHGHAAGLRVLRRRARHDALPPPRPRRRRPRPHRLRRRAARLGPRNVSAAFLVRSDASPSTNSETRVRSHSLQRLSKVIFLRIILLRTANPRRVSLRCKLQCRNSRRRLGDV
jgi:hypothetical protein